MKLNADIVFEELKKKYTVRMTGPRTPDLTISRPELYLDNEVEFLSNHLYLATVEHLPLHPKLQRNIVIVVIGEGAKLSHYRDKCCLIQIREKADYFLVNRDLNLLFDRYYDWEKELFDIFLATADLQEIIDCSVPVLGRDIHVLDASFRYLTRTNDRTDTASLAPQEISQYLSSFEMIMDRHGAVLLDMDSTQYLCVNLFNETGTYIGCVYLEGNGRPFRDSDNALAEYLGSLIEKAIERNPSMMTSDQATAKNALMNLVNDLPLTANQKWQLNLTSPGQHFVCISMHSANRSSRLPKGYICGAFENAFAGAVAFPKENTIVCFMDVSGLRDREGNYYAALNKKLRQFLRETSGVAGVSNGFSDIHDAKIAYFQAEAAIENGMITNQETDLFYFQSYALISLIINSMGNLPADAYFSERLQKLIRHDKEASVSYLETLRIFLRCSMSFSQAAEELYVHRSTVVDRINRIERELGVDLKDPDTRLLLEIVLKAMEIESLVQEARE